MKVRKEVWNLLEIDKILSIFAKSLRSDLGLSVLTAITPCETIDTLRNRQNLLIAYRDYVDRYGDFPWNQNVSSVAEEIHAARKTALLTGQELVAVRMLLLLATRIKDVLNQVKDEFAPFAGVLKKIRDFKYEIESLAVLDEDGNLFDSATPTLLRIRKSEEAVRQSIRLRAQALFANSRINNMLQERLLTFRQNRFTVLVRQEFASRFPGTFIDRSGSDNSVYMEPRSLAELNSRLVLLIQDEEEEKRRILSELTQMILGREKAIVDAEGVLGQIDILYALTDVMGKYGWTLPELSKKPFFVFYDLLHPLLGEKGIPLTIECGRSFHVLVVTGPNTGGKTVALKTVGMGIILAWCGFPLPAKEGTVVGNLDNVFADIGDEQSIEQNLSTFSAHLKNIIHILSEATRSSLVLLDELGAGTDPQEGAALGIALIDTLREKKSITLATTHHNPIKSYALTTPHVETASMEFNVETLAPTYHLLMGIPGRSNAIYIAERYGMPSEVLQKARATLKEQEISMEEVIADLHERKALLNHEWEKMEEQRQKADLLSKEYSEKMKALEEQREKIIAKAEQQAATVLASAEEESRRMIRDLDEAARSVVQRNLHGKRENIREKRKELEQKEEKRFIKKMKDEKRNLEIGDAVSIAGTSITGTILALKGNKAEVQAGAARMDVPLISLTPTSKKVRDALPESPAMSATKPQGVPLSLMIRGMTVDEAMPLVEQYLDRAMRAGYLSVEIIHGRGEGILRREVHQFCAHLSYVESYRLGGPGEGGHGVTIVTFKK
jgi:DNA mismatch repair protein MutS2